MILAQDFYIRNTKKVAIDLLGKILYHTNADGVTTSGRIVETEAYMGIKDPACHTFGDRRTARTEFMYQRGGHSYVYLIYGMYSCLNVVTQTEKEPEAVLIRATEPVPRPSEKVPKNLLHTNGPGKLCRHLGITREHNGLKLWKKNSGLWIEEDDYKIKSSNIAKVPRIGVDYAGDAAQWPLRFYLKDSPWISRK
ncbi:MAG: DNA-3-methyladenine glycosylase [Proteobacteria bacterium]|nr:MAG: DNA-3-methyladenine glycosylase [Pseudomonadota bacterium]